MHLFGTIRLLILSKKSHLYIYSHLYFYTFLNFFIVQSLELLITTQKFWFIHSKLEFFELRFKFKNTDYYISRHKLIENKKKSCLYALIWDYSFINFQQKVPPIRLFSPIFLLIFKEFSHLYFYSDPSSIRNSRVNSPHLLSSDFWTIEILGSQRIIYVLHFFLNTRHRFT